MEVRKIRAEMRMGRSIFDLPMRVTFYARVSTEKDEQMNSLANQVQYYTELIQSKQNWTFVPGYIDEGISGASTKKREDFNRMIADAKAGRFDFIITKEISRFSRSTLDSIKYTQELLEHNVGVLFQNDNINTLDPDSEFRLVVMAGVAQDEIRKLSERLKFGFRQAIKNGRVLGNDSLWGYDKRDCVLTINDEEAQVVRLVFELYANQQLGVRRIAQKLSDLGYTSREGNAFNVLTVRHILTNPKYKGWYCGNKTQTLDYRSKKKVFLEESEWVCHPDPAIPAIVSEELWDRANALYRERSREAMEHASGASFHSRYPYSGKIICEAHNTAYHRQTLKSRGGIKEVWQCRVYRQRGREACSAPQVRSSELDLILSQIFGGLIQDRDKMIETLITALQMASKDVDYSRAKQRRVEEDMAQVRAKKERLLELSMAGALSVSEFKERNDGFNGQLQRLEEQLSVIQAQEEDRRGEEMDLGKIRRALEQELTFQAGVNSALVATILDRAVVKRESTKAEIHLDIYLKLGQQYEAVYVREKTSPCITRLKSITPRPETWTT